MYSALPLVLGEKKEAMRHAMSFKQIEEEPFSWGGKLGGDRSYTHKELHQPLIHILWKSLDGNLYCIIHSLHKDFNALSTGGVAASGTHVLSLSLSLLKNDNTVGK